MQPPISPAHWPYPLWIAHRGGGSLAPENTLPAFACGYGHGFRMAEFDVKLSADNTALLLHDDELPRTAGRNGIAKQMSAAELTAVDVSLGHPQFAGTTIPTLAHIADFCLNHGMAANIEIKPCPGRDRETAEWVGAEALRLWQDADLPPLFSSFSIESMAALQAAFPHSRRGLLIEEWPADNLPLLTQLQTLGCVALHVPDSGTDAARIAYFQAAGYAVLVWTVNDMARAQQLIDWGVNGVITDALDRVFATHP